MADYDELLVHLLMADLLRYATAAFADGRRDVTDRLLRFVDDSPAQGDSHIENAVSVSFVENFGAGKGETPAFLATWPDGLRADLKSQQDWRAT
ncbi:hypothetical protein [Frondihabitans sp. PAMC 28766]|uniref:DUF7674 family protein n=1 Tax=Frondihabitans sp. PAMC 28766 TaxID=1795630 RepID=UPI00138F31FD|nr:hypothetical protein [Frondihabitans sp. PAMC 28766]